MLCQLCKALDISAADFANHGDGLNAAKYEERHDLGKLSDLRARAEGCDLCWLILDAVGNPAPHDTEDHNGTLYWEDDGFVTWKDHATVRRLGVGMRPWPPGFHERNMITCLSRDIRGFNDELFLGRERAKRSIKPGLMRKWLRLCRSWHAGVCDQALTPRENHPASTAPFRVIDCWSLCLSDLPTGGEYLALSYVWGKAPVFMLTAARETGLEEPGGLKPVWTLLPATIRDAVVVTSKLRQRYLWVDSVCIVQDDAAEKRRLIPQMDAIYDQALLVIVAASGEHANAGLPGVRKGAQMHQPMREVVPGLHLMPQKHLVDLLEHSYYETRGWTYQERSLSRRCLYFFEEAIIFECCQAVWRDDANLEDRDVHSCSAVRGQPSLSGITSAGGGLQDYAGCLYWYSHRNLTSNTDVLNAFAGISRILLERTRIAMHTPADSVFMIYGMPSNALDWALLWSPNLTAKRRPGGWPSWSWCGWVGGVASTYSFDWDELGDWIRDHTWIDWQVFDTQGKVVDFRRKRSSEASRTRFMSYDRGYDVTPTKMDVLAVEESCSAFTTSTRTLVHPEVVHAGKAIELLPLLHFYSLMIKCRLEPVNDLRTSTANTDRLYSILGSRGPLGAIWVDASWMCSHGIWYEFVLLSDAKLTQIKEEVRPQVKSETEWNAFNVMLVVPCGSDRRVAQRVAIGVVSAQALDPDEGLGADWSGLWLR